MFAAVLAVCFQDFQESVYQSKVIGMWQAGAGLAIKGKDPQTPGMNAECATSSFLQYFDQCATMKPCTHCKYFPIYPVNATPPLVGCLGAYEDDFLYELCE